MKKTTKWLLCLILPVIFIFTSVATVFAARNTGRTTTVRVGCMDYPGFIEKNEDGRYFGYGVEYLDEICKYTGWKIEYVDKSWNEQLKMLELGEIDIVPIAQYSKERAEKFNYTSQPIGTLQCLLFTLPEGQNDIACNALACNGKTIGILRGSKNIELLEKYAEDIGFTYNKVEYDYQSDLEKALFDRDVDIIACEQMVNADNLRVIDRFGSDPYYFITAKENIELASELDYVISRINAYDPSYTSTLYQKYFGKRFIGRTPSFTKKEAEFIKSCGEVTVALIPGTKPVSYLDDDGNVAGIIPDIMNKISELCGIKFKYTFVPDNITPLAFLKENPGYIASGVMANNRAFEENDVLLSEVYYNTHIALVARSENAEKLKGDSVKYKIGTMKSFQAMQLYIEKNYPNMQIVECFSPEEGLGLIRKNKLDFFAYERNLLTLYLSNPVYGDMSVIDSQFMSGPQCTAALRSPENELLMGIMDKCIAMIPNEDIAYLENEYLRKNIYHFNTGDAIHRYRDTLIQIAVIILSIFAVLITILFIRQRKYTKAITHHAEYDMMTGVYNRVTTKEKVTRILEQNADDTGYTLLVIGIDNLKQINDTRGHTVGDTAIKKVASVLKTQFRSMTVIGRVGGDEFAVFLNGIKSKSILVSALAKLQNKIAGISLGNESVMLTVSIGVAMREGERLTADELYRYANDAMRRVKNNGKNGFAFHQSQNTMSLTPVAKQESEEYVEETFTPPLDADIQKAEETDKDLYKGSDSNYRKILEAFPNVGIYIIEKATHKVLYYNRRFREICPTIKLGISCRNLMFGPCENCIVDTMGEQNMAHTIFYSDVFGDEVEITATKIMWNDTVPAVLISTWSRNILTGSSDKLQSTSNIDAFDYITGSLTRAGFIRMMEKMQSGGVDLTDYAILFINIKDFKAVNEMTGCYGGDNLLHTLFDRIEQSKLHPVIGSRKESDHFVFMVEKASLDLSSLTDLLNFHWQYNDKDLFIHCRCGVFYIDNKDLEVYKMIDRAKLAKENIVDDYIQPYAVYDSSMLEEYSERASAFLLFDNGIKNNEFVVYYQPVIDAKTGKVAGAEALVRRITADGTVIPPNKFIPILERTGYISMLDRFVAESVGAFIKTRKDNDMPIVPVSFNLSQKDFYDESLMEFIANGLEDGGLPKGSVLLELTESAYTMHEKKHKEYLKQLRDAGAKILLDDFGTGYSSFGMFENYNFDRVKLDMSFVRQLRGNENVRMVVKSIVSMCHDLGVQVIAEGVENEEELAILRNVDCDYIQGYLFSKPLPQKEFEEYLSTH